MNTRNYTGNIESFQYTHNISKGFIMKVCKDCNIEKPLSEFYVRSDGLLELRCKKCYLDKYSPNRGKPNTGRFKKGNIPVTRKIIDGKQSLRSKQWAKDIIDRDKKCAFCGTVEKLVAHHIKSWKEYPKLRFNLDNGQTLCNTCHSKLHGRKICNLLKNGTSWAKGKKFSSEYRKKLSDAHLGQVAWNKDKPMREETKQKLLSQGAFFKKGHIPWIKKHGHNEESREKMRKAHTGKILSKETRKKMSIAQKKRYKTKKDLEVERNESC